MSGFSVVTTCYNDEKNIDNYFKNMKAQSIQPIEYIVVDGGSKDATIESVLNSKVAYDLPIRIIEDGRLNIAEGFNRGIKNAISNIVVITGIGNKYADDYFEKIVTRYDSNKNKVIYGPTYGLKYNHFSRAYSDVFLNGDNGIAPYPTNRGVLVEKTIFDEHGYFYEKFVYAGEDTEYFERLKKNGILFEIAEDAKLYWEVPNNFRNYFKQDDKYFIGRLQISGVPKKALHRSLCYWCGIFGPIVLLGVLSKSVLFPIVYLLAIYCIIAFKIKNFDPIAVTLKISSMLLPVVFYLRNRKYGKDEYRVHR